VGSNLSIVVNPVVGSNWMMFAENIVEILQM